jgi:hypothetical protein
MSDIYFKYLELKKGEYYETTEVPYCAGCDKINPRVAIFHGKLKDITVCAECGMPISYKITKKLVRPPELIDFVNSLPKYRKDGDNFIFTDGAVVERREAGKDRWGYEDVTYYDYYCTKCNKKRGQGCIHFISIEEGREV